MANKNTKNSLLTTPVEKPMVKTPTKPLTKPKTSVPRVKKIPAPLPPQIEPAPKPAGLPKPGKKIYPKTAAVLLIILFAVGYGYYYAWQLNKKADLESQENINIIVPKASTGFVIPKIISDQIILPGDYLLSQNAWAPDSQNFFAARYIGETEIGLPEYKTYDIYNFANNTSSISEVKDGIIGPNPEWLDATSLQTQKQILDLTNPEKLMLKVPAKNKIEGFDLLSEVKYTNKNTGKSEGDVTNLTISPNGQYAAFLSTYGSNDKYPTYAVRLFILPKDAKSLDEMINLGEVQLGIETAPPYLTWSKDSQYLLSGDNELFNVKENKTVLAFEGGYHRRLTYFSPDQTKVLVISNFQDKTDQQDYLHETIKIFIKDLATGQEILVENFESTDETLNRVDGSFSANGKYVALNLNHQIWLVDAQNGKKKQLTTQENNYQNIRISPDGNKIIYTVPKEGVRLIQLSWQ